MKKLFSKSTGRGRVALGTGVIAVTLIAAGLAWRGSGRSSLPVADVRRGEFTDYVQIRGDIRAVHSLHLAAPVIGGDLQIVKLVPTGTVVKKGDIVVQFDPVTFQRTLEQKQSELNSADADVEHTRAEGRLSQEQQRTDEMQAGYDVDRTRLDVSKQEILSKIEGEETRLKLADTEQKLSEMHQKSASTEKSGGAEVDRKKQKREKSLFDVRLSESQIAALTVRAPADGMVTILPNPRARGFFGGGASQDFKVGDRAWSGAVIAELPDLSAIRAGARVEESDRGRLRVGQESVIRIDAVAGREFKGTVVQISPLAKVDYSSWPFTKNFDIEVALLENDPAIRPGMSAGGRIAVEKIPDGILVPTRAVFDKDGITCAYVVKGGKFERRTVQVLRRGTNDILIGAGLAPGEKVALKDPTETNAE